MLELFGGPLNGKFTFPTPNNNKLLFFEIIQNKVYAVYKKDEHGATFKQLIKFNEYQTTQESITGQTAKATGNPA